MSTGGNHTLTRLRRELGYSQEAYAAAVGATPRQVRNWEAGRVACPQRWYLERMHALHGTTAPEQLGFSCRAAVDPATVTDRSEADMHRRNVFALAAAAAFGTGPVTVLAGLLDPAGAGRAVGRADVDHIARLNQQLTAADFLVGGGALDPDTLLDRFRWAARRLHGTIGHDATRAALHSQVAHLGSTVGFMLFDAGAFRQSTAVYAASLRIAADAPDRWPLRAIVFSEMSRQALHLGQVDQASELLHLAAGAGTEIPASAHALLHALTARVHAARGDQPGTDQHVRLAEDAFASRQPGTEPGWISWFDSAELDGETGAAAYEIALHHDPGRNDAADRLTRAAASCQPTDQRSRALTLTRLAHLHAARHDHARTADATRTALAAVRQIRSPRITSELAALRPRLAALRSHRDIADVDHELLTYIAGHAA